MTKIPQHNEIQLKEGKLTKLVKITKISQNNENSPK